MADQVKQSCILQVEPSLIYEIFLDKSSLAQMTGKEAEIEKMVGSEFTLIDGYFTGKVELMHMNKRIVYSLRSTDFNDEDEDSQLEILFDINKNGDTKVNFVHTNIPEGEGKKYRKEIKDSFVTPLKDFFKKD